MGNSLATASSPPDAAMICFGEVPITVKFMYGPIELSGKNWAYTVETSNFSEVLALEKQSENWMVAGCAVVSKKRETVKARRKNVREKATHGELGVSRPAMAAWRQMGESASRP